VSEDPADIAARHKRAAGLTVIEPEPAGASVIDTLREAIDDADKGSISSVGLAIVYRDGTVGTAWSEVPSMALLIGAAARLQWRLIQEQDDE
jgi:hypothetical protein